MWPWWAAATPPWTWPARLSRAGAKTSTLVYRRTKKYMPADAEELELAVEDGVRFLELVAPVEQANGKLKCEVMKLGDPDEKGRRSPVPTGNSLRSTAIR